MPPWSKQPQATHWKLLALKVYDVFFNIIKGEPALITYLTAILQDCYKKLIYPLTYRKLIYILIAILCGHILFKCVNGAEVVSLKETLKIAFILPESVYSSDSSCVLSCCECS